MGNLDFKRYPDRCDICWLPLEKINTCNVFFTLLDRCQNCHPWYHGIQEDITAVTTVKLASTEISRKYLFSGSQAGYCGKLSVQEKIGKTSGDGSVVILNAEFDAYIPLVLCCSLIAAWHFICIFETDTSVSGKCNCHVSVSIQQAHYTLAWSCVSVSIQWAHTGMEWC